MVLARICTEKGSCEVTVSKPRPGCWGSGFWASLWPNGWWEPAELHLCEVQSRLKCNSQWNFSMEKLGHSVCCKQETKRCFHEMCFYLKRLFLVPVMIAVPITVLLCARENKPLDQMLGFWAFFSRMEFLSIASFISLLRKKEKCKTVVPYI